MTGRPNHSCPQEENGQQANDAGPSLPIPPAIFEAFAARVAGLVTEALPQQPAPYLDVKEAAAYLACKPKRIYELKDQGRLAHYGDGRRLLFRHEDLDAALVRRDAG